MNNVIFNEGLDTKVAGMEANFRSTLEQYLVTLFGKPVSVQKTGPEGFDFKEMKASLPGEIVFATLTATDGGPGRILYALNKDDAGRVADLLLMGDGKAQFTYDEHVEPLRELYSEVTAAFASGLGKELGKHIAFDEIKVALVDLNPTDFVGTDWTISQFRIDLTPPAVMFRLISKDFLESCFPDADHRPEEVEREQDHATDYAELRREMGLVLDVELPITIELGRTSMLIRDIVQLAPGSIVELDKLSGEPVDLYVNNKRFARGEVVVVDENFAVRLTELIGPDERMRASRN